MKRWCLVVLVLLAGSLAAQQVKTLEFRNQDIRDILLAFGELNGVSIVPDDTVDGKATYVFSNMQFDEALQRFLSTFHLVATKKDSVYLVSRVGVTPKADGTFDLQVYETPVRTVIQILSTTLAQAVLFDNLPNDPVTLNLRSVTLAEVLKVLTAKYPDFSVQKQDKYYYIRNTATANAQGAQTLTGITRAGDRYSVQVQKVRFRDAVATLFQLAKVQYVMVLDRDVVIDSINLTDLSWEDALKTVLLFGSADFVVSQDLYYILEAQKRDLLKQFLINVVVPLEYVSSADVQRLIPADLTGSNYKLDEKNNRVVLTGTQEQINPIWQFLKTIDRPLQKNTATRFDLNYIKTDDLFPLLPSDLNNFGPLALPGKSAFILTAPLARLDEVRTFLSLVDRPSLGVPVRLRYLKADDLFTKLPPSVTDASLAKTNDPSLIFFKGTLAQKKEFLDDLAAIDTPRAQLRYEVFVLQFDEGKGVNVDAQQADKQLGSAVKSLAGNFRHLSSVNFDVIANLGANFALSLSVALKNNNSKVLADTTLTGLSGEKLTFQNTQTIRYSDNQINPDTGKFVEIIRDLPSGLLLTLEGWVSADNMITVKVDSTLSQAVVSTAATAGTASAPSTFEKKIATTVRTPSGKPLVLSGLKQDQVTTVVSRLPILGDIPWLGALFETRSESVTRTEFSIYIVPILERPEIEEAGETARLAEYYQRWSRIAL